MGKKDKLIARFRKLPKDFTFDEMCRLVSLFGFKKQNKGKTSGSSVMFVNEKGQSIMLHKPHPEKIIKAYAMKQVLDKLIEMGYLDK